MRIIPLLAAISLGACATPPENGALEAQRVVEQVVANHPRLVRLTIHAIPAGETGSRIVASNVGEKIGQRSDPEDLEVLNNGGRVVLREGANLDVTMPVVDRDGEIVAATGITLSNDDGRSEAALLEEAEAIARELTSAIRAKDAR